LVVGVVMGFVITLPIAAAAFNQYDLSTTPRYTAVFCVESTPPDVTVAQATVLVDAAIVAWEVAAGQDTGQAVDLSQDTVLPCDSGTIRVRYSTSTNESAAADPVGLTIVFYGDEWWDGLGTQGANEWSYRGSLHTRWVTFWGSITRGIPIGAMTVICPR
jgi:hypothetical protein